MEMTVIVFRTITDLILSLGLATKQIGDNQLSELWSTLSMRLSMLNMA
jgi:hypothetical protein